MSAPELDPISALHNAVTARLLPYFPPEKWQIEPVPAPLSLKEFEALTGRTPWIGVSWTEFRGAQASTKSLHGNQSLRLTVCVKNPGRGARFFGDRGGPGLYPSLTTAAAALHGQNITGIGSLTVVRVAQVFADGYGNDTIAIGAIDITCDTGLGDVLDAVEAAPAFARLVSQFELVGPDGSTQPIATDTFEPPECDA